MDLKETVRFAHQRLRLMVAQIVKEELGDCVDGLRFTGPYEGEEFHVIITLRYEPDDFEERDSRLHLRVWELGHDITLSPEFPEETITV